jgi:hypothetical protein
VLTDKEQDTKAATIQTIVQAVVEVLVKEVEIITVTTRVVTEE